MAVQVTITECYGERRTFTSTHRDAGNAERAAIEKAYGRGHFLYLDRGLSEGTARYGEIARPVGRRNPNVISTVTGRVRIDIEEI
ncbi:hypothetical protein ACIU0H_05185 [Pseudomonas aeruginosa]